jgi:DNA-binding IclR family transcriptional regulator
VSQSLARALQILVRLGEGPAGLDELAAVTGVHKTTVLRLLRTLADHQFVFRDGAHRYHLGARVFELSSRGLDQHEVRRIAAPHLSAFNRRYGRTTHLAVLEAGEVVYVDKLESHDHIRMHSRIGVRAALHATAVAKVLLADLPVDQLRELVAGMDFPVRAANTITDPAAFLAELEQVRRQGWAQDHEENEPSINCVAAPVRGASGRVLAAVSVSVPDIVLSFDELLGMVPALLDVTATISTECGWTPPEPADPRPLRRTDEP